MKKAGIWLVIMSVLVAQGREVCLSASFLEEIKPVVKIMQELPAAKSDAAQPRASDFNAKKNAISYEQCLKLIDGIAFLYAAHGIYKRYHALDRSNLMASSSLLYRWYPQIMRDAENKAGFFIDATIIVMQTILYKTVAKLLLVCAYGDMTDAVEFIGSCVKRVVGIVW